MKKALLVVVGLVFVVMIIVAINSTSSGTAPPTRGAPSAATAPASAQAPDAPPKESWSYDQSTDQMTGKVTRFACLDSEDQLQFDPPYDGGTTGTICFRKGRGLDAYFKIDKGQILCGVESCEARIKVDGGEPITVSASESNDGDPRFIFFESYPHILAIAKKAKVIKVEMLYYQEGRRVLTFEPSEPLDPKW
ncbi:MAG: hypothetical protein ACLQHF_03300 [Terracidiphilus sp.]